MTDSKPTETQQSADEPEARDTTLASPASIQSTNNTLTALTDSKTAKKLPTTDADPALQQPSKESAETKSPISDRLEPTRYGDWVKNGRCIDF